MKCALIITPHRTNEKCSEFTASAVVNRDIRIEKYEVIQNQYQPKNYGLPLVNTTSVIWLMKH